MPTLSIYVNDEIYAYLMSKGKPSAVAKEWIGQRHIRETEHAQKMETIHMGLDG